MRVQEMRELHDFGCSCFQIITRVSWNDRVSNAKARRTSLGQYGKSAYEAAILLPEVSGSYVTNSRNH